jgi:hypothetical protein
MLRRNVLVKYLNITAVHIKHLFIYSTISVACNKCLGPRYYCGVHNVSLYLPKYTDLMRMCLFSINIAR